MCSAESPAGSAGFPAGSAATSGGESPRLYLASSQSAENWAVRFESTEMTQTETTLPARAGLTEKWFSLLFSLCASFSSSPCSEGKPWNRRQRPQPPLLGPHRVPGAKTVGQEGEDSVPGDLFLTGPWPRLCSCEMGIKTALAAPSCGKEPQGVTSGPLWVLSHRSPALRAGGWARADVSNL